MGPNGQFYIIWRCKPFIEATQTIAEEFATCFSRSVDDGDAFVTTAWEFSGSSAMAVSPEGRLFIVWVNKTEDDMRELSVSYSDNQGAAFSDPVYINGSKGDLASVCLEALSSNKIAVLFTDYIHENGGDVFCTMVDIP